MHPFRIASRADVERIESRPYAEYMAHVSVFDALADAASRHGDRPALTFVVDAERPAATRHWTHREFLTDVRRAANAFRALCDGEEPRVALLLPAIPQMYFALWGAETAGVACPINYLLTADHIAELIDASGANLLVALGPNPELDIWSRVAGLRERCPRLKRVLAVGGADRALGADDFDAVLAAQPGDALTFDRAIRADTLAALFHTGGTTGAPKLARHSHGNQLHSAWSAAQMYAMDERDVVINGFPLFHVAGSIVYGLSTLLSGAEIVLPTLLGMRNARFVPRYWDVVERHRVTFLAVVPTILSTLLGVDPKDADFAGVRAAFTGGSPLPPELAAAFEARFRIPVRNILGMTECAGVVSIEPFLDVRRPGSCGLPLPYTRVEAVAGDGTACAPGEPGVLRLRGPNVGPGYTDARRNPGTFGDDGWLVSGDIGHVDEDGIVFITGRAKDVIIRGSHNIEPALIEEALMRHPDVQFAAAVGAPDEYAGEVPVAFVVPRPGATLDPQSLLDFVRGHIAEPPAHPKRIDLLEALPLTAVGKVYKPALRLRAIERVIVDRLERVGLAGTVEVTGIERPGGLAVELAARDGSPSRRRRSRREGACHHGALRHRLGLVLMTTSLPLRYDKRGAVATITFDRPEARNALTPEMICRLADAVRDFAADDALRVAILTGSGDKAFCAGGDLGLTLPLMTGARAPADDWDRRVLGDPLVAAASQLRGFPLDKPVIAAVNGACLAAGTEILLGTDIRIAAEHASFGLPEVTRGLVPFAGSMVRLPRQMPWCQAMELMLTGSTIAASEALRIGLVNHVVAAGDVMAKAQEIAERIARTGRSPCAR